MHLVSPCEPRVVNPSKSPTSPRSLYQRAHYKPLTLPYLDLENRLIQLWNAPKYGLVGAILDANKQLTLISGKNIHNPLNRDESPEHLVTRLENCGLRYWQIAYQANLATLTIWPNLEGAGKDGDKRTRPIWEKGSPFVHTSHADLKAYFIRRHFAPTGDPNAFVNEKRGLQVHFDRRGEGRQNPPEPTHIDMRFTPERSAQNRKERERIQADLRAAKDEELREKVNSGKMAERDYRKEMHQYDKNQARQQNDYSNLRAKWRFAYDQERPKDPSNGKNSGPSGGGSPGGGKPTPTPGVGQFKEALQKNGLTSTYNNNHADNPVPAKGAMSGEIGGVGCSTELIQGLFDNPDAIFDHEHLFFLPTFGDGQLPMTDLELGQILRELAIGIYVHDTVPFFSLHFNQNSDLYPVIHPAYENTLVGQVISLLDYFMKGYLNGGIFKEEFIKKWEEDPSWERKKGSALQQMIDFTSYCQKNLQGVDKQYSSLRRMLEITTSPELLKRLDEQLGKALENAMSDEPAIFTNNTLFSNSFRIIAKQKSIQKADNMFVLDGDFDVFYTIDPAPAYKKELEQYQKIHGQPPRSYQMMVQAYEQMRDTIHDHMVKLPICSKYFAMLGVINFFCSYMMTLKKQRKIPIFPLLQPTQSYSSPALFPHLPLEHLKKETLQANVAGVVKNICSSKKALLMKYLTEQTPHPSVQLELTEALTQLFMDSVLHYCSTPMRRHLTNKPDLIRDGMVNLAKNMLEELKKKFPSLLEQTRKAVQEARQLPNREEIRQRFDLYDKLRSVPVSQFDRFINTIQDVQGATIFNEIRQMSSREYAEIKANLLNATDQMLSLRTLKEQDLPSYIIDNYLPKLFEDQQANILSLQVNILHLSSEVSKSTIEQGKRVVGGCGMALSPMRIVPSLKGEAILQEHWAVVQQLEPEKWVKIGNEEDNEFQGAVFKLMIEDLPPEMDEDYSWMENLFIASSQEMVELYLITQQFKEAMLEDDEEGFAKLVKDHGPELHQMRDNNGTTLVHLAAMQKNRLYIQELLKKGLSAHVQDKKKYQPIHYAAMYGNENIVAFLLDADPHLINAESNNKSTPLIVAIQNGQESVARLLLDRKAAYTTVTSEGYTPLHCALHHGHEGIATVLLEQPGIDVNKSTEEGVTPLMLACDLDSEKLVKALLHKGANPAAERKDGVIALDIAVKRNYLPICKILLPLSKLSDSTIEIGIKESSLVILELLSTKPSFLTYRNYAEDTPLILAIRFGNIPAALHILSLMKNATDLSVENVFKESAISLSAACGFVELIEAMIKKGAVVNPKQLLKDLCRIGTSTFLTDYISTQTLSAADLQELLQVAAEAGQHAVISTLLVPRQVNLDALQGPKGWKIEHYLIKSDGIFLLRQRVLKTNNLLHRLVEDGGKTLAYLAAENGSWGCFKFLLAQMVKNNIPLNNHYQTRHLAYAVIERGDLNGVRLMYDAAQGPVLVNRDLDGRGTTGVHLAAKIGSKEILRFLHSQGAKCDQEDADGKTPLYYAVQCKSERAIKFLLSETCKAKMTPEVISLAFSVGLNDLLLQAGANLDIKCSLTGDTPLLLAIKKCDYNAFSELIKRGASLDCINAEGWTPTLLASETGQHNMLEAILRQGYVDRRVNKGDNALHLACKKGHTECIRLLIQVGFSAQQPNGENKAPEVLAAHSVSALAALGVKEEPYAQFIGQFVQALSHGKAEAIQEMINVLPINEMISIQWHNEKISGTLLHLILRLIGQSTHIKPIVDILLQNQQLNVQLRDSEGSAYAHLLVKAEIQPKNLSLDVVDYQGRTPLHYAAARCDEMFLSELFKTSNAKKMVDVPDREGMTPLFYAIMSKETKNIELLLSQGANPNHRDRHLYTPLLMACQEGFFPAFQRLLQAGADVNMRGTVEHLTPLFMSLAIESDEISLYLMMKGADCRAKKRDGLTIAHAAAQSGKINVLRFLSSKGISLNEPNAKGIHPIHLAARKGQNQVLELLLAEKVSLETMVTPRLNQDETDKNLFALRNAKPIHFASMTGRVDTVHWLLNHHVNPESKIDDRYGVLGNAAQANCIPLIEMFRQYQLSQDPNQVFPAISIAIQRDYADSVVTLYQLGIPIDAEVMKGWTGLHLACKLGSVRTTHTLLNQDANPDIPNGEGQKPIEIAASNPSVDQFWQMIVRTEPDLDAINGKGETLLSIAVKAGNLAHAMLLIIDGAALDIPDHTGETPLHAAVKKGRLDLIGLLIGCGADCTKKTFIGEKTAQELSDKPNIIELIDRYNTINEASHEEETLLHCAIKAKIIEAVRVLCLATDVNQAVPGGETALHMAVAAESIPMIRILLSHGANIEAQDDLGHTPLWKACLSERNVLLARILIKAGANRAHENKSGESIIQALSGIDFPGKEQMLKLLNA